MSGWDVVSSAVSAFISRPSPHPPFVGTVEATGNGLAVGEKFVPEASYFGVRLVDMRLAEGGKYFVNYLPLGVCVAEYTYGAERRRVPLVLGSDKVKQMLGGTGGEPGHVQFTNIPVVQRAPMKHDNLALFIGLFRMPYSDIAHSVLQLAADVSEELGGKAIGSVAGVATKLYDRVTEMFSLKTVEPRFAFLDGMALSQSGYVLVSGPLPAGTKGSDFVVEQNRLRLRADKQAPLPADLDYCVLAMEHTGSLLPSGATAGALGALAGLPFHKQWQEVSTLLTKRDVTKAEEALLALRGAVIVSPDVTEDDRLTAIGAYDLIYAQYAQALSKKPGADETAKRGFRSGTPATGLKAVAEAHETGGDKAVASALNAIALQLLKGRVENVPMDGIPDAAVADAFSKVRETMSAARKQGLQAKTLANALEAASFRTSD
jgi:hypothetical protein